MSSSSSIQRFFAARVTLNQFRALNAIADLRQLKKAAAALHVSPSAISKQVSEMEEALGEVILKRQGGRLEFTPAGLLLVSCAREVMAQLDRTKAELSELYSGAGGAIAIGAVPSVAPIMLPDLVLELRRTAPNASVRLLESRFDLLAQALDRSSIDIAIARYTQHQLSVNFAEERLFSDPLIVVVGSQHPIAAKRRRVGWRDLTGAPWILPPQGSETFLQLSELLQQHQLKLPPGCIESMSFSVNAALLQRYRFVALMPLRYARPYLEANQIRKLPLRSGGIQDEIKAVWRKDNQNPMIDVLLACIRKIVEPLKSDY